ncbi:MAG: ATP-binding cassette domain-containing protein [Myxococcales bacterium]|nr:ATP-binding cassette domain-containing protein [Myxococcales bacterium]
MGAGVRLLERFSAQMARERSAQPPERVQFACEFVRLLMQTALVVPERLDSRFGAALRVTRERSGLDAAAAGMLIRLAASPEFRGIENADELNAFVSRFGEAAGQALRADEESDLDLIQFAGRYGSWEALLLLDSMFATVAGDGDIDPTELRRLENAARELGIDGVLFSALHQKHEPRYRTVSLDGAPTGLVFQLTGERVSIGRSPGNHIVLPDPQVGGHHVDLVRASGGWMIVDAESGRPTVLNSRPVTRAPLAPGDELRVGPFRGTLGPAGTPLADSLVIHNDRVFTALSMRGLTRIIKAGGNEVSLLDDVSFTVFSGEVIAMVGPSGAGKTTLLNAIAGVTPADCGQVLFDGRDFHAMLAVDRSQVGTVPQDDIVHPELTVEESLDFSGRLRFPPDTPEVELKVAVTRVLQELGIDHIRGSRIGDATRRGISGGQRKRVNLGQELLSRSTRVLFLDEPTSGLDPRAAQDIVRLVRQLADRGRIVFIVTHDLSPQVMAQVDHLLVLAPGGRVAFFGPPARACAYFNVATPDAIFNKFQDKTPAAFGEAYRASPDFRTFVTMREDLLKLPGRSSEHIEIAPRRVSRLQQLVTQVRRYAKVKLRDRTGLWVLAAQPPFLALVMFIVFPKPTKAMIFMLTLSCLWFGMSAAVRELIADRVIWARERRVGLGVVPYVGSKVVVLGTLAVLQCTFLASLDWAVFGLGDYGFNPASLALMASLTGVCGMALGLLVSATFSSSEAAVGTLPLLLIPQISFSSLLVGLREMNSVSRAVTAVDPLRYAFDALLKVGDKLAEPSRIVGKWDTHDITGALYELGLKGTAADDSGLSRTALAMVLLGFTAAFLFGAFMRVKTRGTH